MTPKQTYYNQKALEYLQRHPEASLSYARRQARLRYRRYNKAISQTPNA